MTLVNWVMLCIASYCLFLICGAVYYYYKYQTRNNKALKTRKNEVFKVFQDKIDQLFNDFNISETDMCAQALSEHIEINGVKYFYEITVILDVDGSKEIRIIDIKLKRE